MPYAASGLTSLLSADSFTLWLYRTADTRAAVLGANYFHPAANRLLPGHMVILQSGDGMSFLPVRSNAAVGNGLVLDAAAPPLRLAAGGSLDVATDLAADAVARSLSLGPVPTGLTAGQTFTVQASVTGPVGALRFVILNASGAVVAGPTDVAVSSGNASTTFTAPSPGNGYRLRATDTTDSLVTQLSPSFVVTAAYGLLIESGLSLLAESGSRLVL